MPQWNVNSLSFVFEYDSESMVFTGFESTQTMLENATINYTLIQPGMVAFTCTNPTSLSGAGTLLKLKFEPLAPGDYAFNLSNFTFNSTPVSMITQLAILVTASISEPQNSVIDLMNAMHIPHNEIATVPINTTFVMPSWNVQNVSFTINYPADLLTWEGYDATDCLTQGATIAVNTNTTGAVSLNISFPQVFYGMGNLINLKFRATGSPTAVTLATLTPTNFYYGTTLVQNLQPGYIVLLPVTANQEEVALVVQKFNIYPNPFSSSTNLNLELNKQNQAAVIEIYNLKGQLVRKLFNGSLKGSKLDMAWDGKDDLNHNAQPGFYIAKVKSGTYTKSLKLLKQ
jgi:hypothetical protein